MTDDESQAIDQPYFVQRLQIDAGADERAIKRAYARELKLIDQEADPAAFQDLREAYDAALFWQRHEQASQLGGDADPFDEIGRAAMELQLRPAPAGGNNSADRAAPPSAPPEIDAQALSQEVFAEFQSRCAKLRDVNASESWKRELQGSLADTRLIHIAARQAFEQRIANLLAEGWRPGHHLLLVVAAKVFEWESDRRRVQALGAAGYALHVALEQRAMYDLQPGEACEVQRQLIVRLRASTPPATNELIDLMPVLATVEARFPAWLSLITDTDNIARWHTLDQSVSAWRRTLRRRDFKFHGWPVVVVIMVVVLLGIFFSFSAPGKQEPSPQAIAAQHVVKGNEFLDNSENDKAVLSFDQAIAKDPSNAAAYAGRAMALVQLSEKTRALADLKKLQSLQPGSPVLHRARGLIAEREGRNQDAIVLYTRALEIDPQNGYTLIRRGYVYRALGELDKALTDADQALEVDPGRPTAHWLRARVFMDRKDTARVKAEAAAVLLTADPRGESAYRTAAYIYQETGDTQDALALMDKAVGAAPVAANYLERAQMRPVADTAARRTDIEAALKLEPDSSWGLRSLVNVELQARQWDAVIAAANRAMEHQSTKNSRQYLMSSRGIGYAKLVQMDKATEDFKSARLAAKTPGALNGLCYELAVNDVALPTALATCDAALAQTPKDWHTLDSKGFTLMRMKRYPEALATYDAALSAGGDKAEPLYGRGIVKRRLGDKKGGQLDIDAALALNPEIGTTFARMDLVP